MQTFEQPVIRPLLARFAVPRRDSDDLPGFYSSRLDVWVVDGPNGERPIIGQSLEYPEVTPVTKQKGERDAIGSDALVATVTTTFTRGERDDMDFSSLLELQTKTEEKRERDDPTPSGCGYLLELVTTTRTRQEQDDR